MGVDFHFNPPPVPEAPKQRMVAVYKGRDHDAPFTLVALIDPAFCGLDRYEQDILRFVRQHATYPALVMSVYVDVAVPTELSLNALMGMEAVG